MNEEEVILRLVDIRRKSKEIGLELSEAIAIEEAIKILNRKKKARWVRYYEYISINGVTDKIPRCACSECGKEFDPRFAEFIDFCPYCGHEIEKEGEENDQRGNQSDH